MNTYEINLLSINESDETKDDEVTVKVEADSPLEAIEIAKKQATTENPLFNHLRAWSWSIRQYNDLRP